MRKLLLIILLCFPLIVLARSYGPTSSNKASKIKTDTTKFQGILSASDVNVQVSLQTLSQKSASAPSVFSEGSVPFGDTTGSLIQDNANFNYLDSTNDLTVTGKYVLDSDSDSYLRYNTSTMVVELFVDGTKQVQWPITGAVATDIVLLEIADAILFENGVDSILIE